MTPETAALDAEILAKAEELGSPSRRELARAMGLSPARVQRAYTRQREAEAAATGEEPKAEKAAPGGRPRKPLLEVAQAVTVAAWRASQGWDLPKTIRRALASLKGRDGWQDELEAAVRRRVEPAADSPPAEGRTLTDRLVWHLDRIEADLRDGELSRAEEIRMRESVLRFAQSIEKLAPTEQLKDAIEPAQIAEAAHSGMAKLQRVAARLKLQREATVQAMLERARERGPAHHEATVWTLRELGALPRGEDNEQTDREGTSRHRSAH
jgi:hypothetical protein